MKSIATGLCITLIMVGCTSYHNGPNKSAGTQTTTLVSRLFPLPNVSEQALVSSSTQRPLGIAFSGGGSRALSATMGQMRGLRHLGVLEQTLFISSVSGGALASTLYTYLIINAMLAPQWRYYFSNFSSPIFGY